MPASTASRSASLIDGGGVTARARRDWRRGAGRCATRRTRAGPAARPRRRVRGRLGFPRGGGRRPPSRRGRDRERLAVERHQRLAGDPRRRLIACTRVADVTVGGDQRAQVVERRRPAGAADRARVDADGQQPLDRECRRLGVRAGARHAREAAVAVLLVPDVLDRARPVPSGATAADAGECLERGARVVDVALPAPRREVEAAVGVLLAYEPRRRCGRRRDARRAQRQHRERGPVRLVVHRPVPADVGPQFGEEIASAEAGGGQPRGAGDEDVPLEVAGIGRRGDAALDVGDQAVALAHDVLRVLAGGG